MQPPTESKTGNEMPCLPTEIILAICHCFTVDSHNPAKSYHVSLDTRDNISALRQLSLTCRSIHTEVTPALYSCIYFTGPMTDSELPLPTHCQHPGAESLVYFLRTILENAKLRLHVKDLACLIDLRDACRFKEEMNTVNKDYGILPAVRKCKDINTKHLLDMADLWIAHSSGSGLGFEAAFGTTSRRPIISTSHQIFASIVCLLPNVSSISLKTGCHRPCYPCSPGPRLYDLQASGTAEQFRCSMTRCHPMENLRTLQLQCESESTLLEPHNDFIDLLGMVPVVCNAFNLKQVRCYGSESSWRGLPGTVASFESWGPVSILPFIIHFEDPVLLHLKIVVIHLDCASKVSDFKLDSFCQCLAVMAPAVEHLEVVLSPGTCMRSTMGRLSFSLYPFSQLRYFRFDTRFFSDIYWDEPLRQDLGTHSHFLPSSIEALSIVDSEPRRNSISILKWLQALTRILLRPENLSQLKRVEYLHMPPLAGANHNTGSWSSSNLANELKQELEPIDVQFQHYLVGKGDEFAGADLPEQEDCPVEAHIHGTDA